MSGVQLFSDKRFFILQRVPARASLIQDIERHGGRVVKLESQADHVIADHLRKDAPAGSLSYTFVERAIKDNVIPDLSNHTAGLSTTSTSSAHPAGGIGLSQPIRATRTPFTADDDRVLWDWVKRAEAAGGSVRGNEIYKELERKNPRHTYQSWRDRYVKTLSMRGAPATRAPPQPGPPTPPSEPTAPSPAPQFKLPRTQLGNQSRPVSVKDADEVRAQSPAPPAPASRFPAGFTQEDLENVIREAPSIEDIPFSRWDAAWETWAENEGRHSAKEWESFYKTHVRKEYLKRQGAHETKGPEIIQLDGASLSRSADSGELIKMEHAGALTSKRSHRTDDKERAIVRSPKRQRVESRPDTKSASGAGLEEKVVASTAEQLPTSEPVQTTSPFALAARRAPLETGSPSSEPRKSSVLFPEARRSSIVLNGFESLEHSPSGRDTKHATLNHSRESPSIRTSQRRTSLSPEPIAPSGDLSPYKHQSSHGERRRTVSPGLSTLSWPPPQEPASLTVANLAEMRAQHQRSARRRARDIIEDDEQEDQSEYVGFLQSVLPKQLLEEAPPVSKSAPHSHSETVEGSIAPPARMRTSRQDSQPLVSRNQSEGRKSGHNVGTKGGKSVTRDSGVTHGSSPGLQTRLSGSKNAFAQSGTAFRLPTSLLSSSVQAVNKVDGEADEAAENVSEDLELSLPEPEGDFMDEVSSDMSEVPPVRTPLPPMKVETQAIFDAETQPLDFSLPGIDDFLSVGADHETYNNRRHSDFLQNDDQPASPIPSECSVDVDSYINARVNSGFKEEDVIRALEATCMHTRLANGVLKCLKEGQDVPTGISGVWTEQDDADLQGRDASKIQALERKHGSRGVNHRTDFLGQYE